MQSRYLHALCACAAYIAVAALYACVSPQEVDLVRAALWGGGGIVAHICLSQLFGFDPYRTHIPDYAPAHVRYLDRWELRLGQATLSLLGGAVALAHWIDPDHFVAAVVSAVLAAWMYFAGRLYAGGYDLPAKSRAR
jgi:hypothetical protein